MRLIIDRFEGNFALCEKEDSCIVQIELERLPKGAAEGDVLVIENDKLIIDEAATKARKNQISKISNDIWK
jgi:urease accessory protein UreE